jgi:transposase
MSKHSMVCAGIDTGKYRLDVALDCGSERLQVDNDENGHGVLSAWLRRRRVKRVGIEASGGYEKAVVARLRRDGFVVVVFQPAQVRAYACFQLQRAKNDAIDASLIAACTAAVKKIHTPPDPRLASLAEHLRLIEQIEAQIVCFRNYLESPCEGSHGTALWSQEIQRFEAVAKEETKALVAAIRRHRDLGRRLELIASIDGIGLRTAIAILVRMPEIGRITREQAAALAGLAPYDDDSGEQAGARHIWGGRERLRKSLYAAALAASFRWNPQLMALYKRLTAAGKCHRAALVACARKLIVFANAVVARGTPWSKQPLKLETPASSSAASPRLFVRPGGPFLRPDPRCSTSRCERSGRGGRLHG